MTESPTTALVRVLIEAGDLETLTDWMIADLRLLVEELQEVAIKDEDERKRAWALDAVNRLRDALRDMREIEEERLREVKGRGDGTDHPSGE